MYSETFINEKLTLATFNYHSDELPKNSKKKIVVTCINCHQNIRREKRNAKAKHRCPSVVGENKRCFKCEQWKDLSFFPKNPSGSGGVGKMCKECFNNHKAVKRYELRRKERLRQSFYENFDLYLRNKVSYVKNNCKRKNIDFNLDFEFLQYLWKKQQGKCYYSGIPMLKKKKDNGFLCWDGPTLDRVNPSGGYLKNNVVWCIFAINSFKQSLEINEFEEQIKNIRWWFNK